LFHLSTVRFQNIVGQATGQPVVVQQRIDQAGQRLPLDEQVLGDTDTMMVFGLDHMITEQEASEEEIEAVRKFLTFDKYTEDPIALFKKTGVDTVFENLEGFPADWKTNTPAFTKFVREHQCPSFLEYGEYPFVSADEIKKALKVKAALSNMLDQMQ